MQTDEGAQAAAGRDLADSDPPPTAATHTAPASAPGARRVRWLYLRLLGMVATGNFAFFSLLSLTLCVPLFDDGVLPGRRRPPRDAPEARRLPAAPAWIGRLPLLGWIALSAVPLVGFLGRDRVPGPVLSAYGAVMPFRLVNHYGLFARMTTRRPEIVVEGSEDGREWRPYLFFDKPVELDRKPRLIAPLQPRLDWQMWFAALGSVERNRWVPRFLERLLEGEPTVLGLLRENPFPGAPPRYVRAVVYHYRFTTSAELRATGHWWKRERARLYLPVLSREATTEEKQEP